MTQAWADGAEIEFRHSSIHPWISNNNPEWNRHFEYRIKPEPKKTVKRWQWVIKDFDGECYATTYYYTESEAKKVYGDTQIIKRLDYTELEFDE